MEMVNTSGERPMDFKEWALYFLSLSAYNRVCIVARVGIW